MIKLDALEHIFYSATCYLLEKKYKRMCINCAKFARLNRDDDSIFNTAIIYAKSHYDKFRFFKTLKQEMEFLQ